MKRVAALLGLFLLTAPSARADEITLDTGGVIRGRIIKDSDGKLTIQVDSGTITLDRKQVVSIRAGRTLLDDFEDRAAALEENATADDTYAVGSWARRHGLTRRAREMFEKTLERDADHDRARRALGYVRYSGQWMTREEVNLAAGLVKYKGKWVTPAERLLYETAAVEKELARLKHALERERIRMERRAAPRPRREVVHRDYVLGIKPARTYGPRIYPTYPVHYVYVIPLARSGGCFRY